MTYDAYTPTETVELISRAGVAKANMRLDRIFFSSVSAGCLLSFSCATLLSTNSSPWYQENAPGLIRTLAALVFPYGLCMVYLTGADLCTGSFLFTTVAVLHRRLSITKMLIHWAVTFIGNLAGSLFIVTIVAGYGGVFDTAEYKKEAITFAITKLVTPSWQTKLLRGIGGNWLVCMAWFLGITGREGFSKIIGIWWPTFAFMSLGFDHVVAQMFFVPIGIWFGAPKITIRLYIWKGIIPVLIGNIIGGAFFVAGYYWYQYLQGQGAIVVDEEPYPNVPNVNLVLSGRKKQGDEELAA